MKTRINLKAVALIIAVVFTVGAANATEKVTKASSHENNIETSLAVESWMINDAIWNTSDAINFTEASDEVLNIESWMTNSDVWSTSADWAAQTEEANLEVEDWMTSDSAWNVASAQVVEAEVEGNLGLESWMINERVWNI